MAVTLLSALGAAWATAEAGLSGALGAFLAGPLIAETELRHEAEADLAPFKGLLLGLFFVSVGMRIDPGAVAAAPVLLPASAVGLIAIKAAIVYPLCRAFGLPRPVAVEAALFMLLVTVLTMAATPLLATLGRRLVERGAARAVPATV